MFCPIMYSCQCWYYEGHSYFAFCRFRHGSPIIRFIRTATDTIDDFSFIFITLWRFMPKGIVVACVCPFVARQSVCLSARKLYLVRTITLPRFELESPHSHQTCILGYTQQVLKMGVIDLQDHLGHFDLELSEIQLVRAITCNGFELQSPNLHQICILGFSYPKLVCAITRYPLKLGSSNLDQMCKIISLRSPAVVLGSDWPWSSGFKFNLKCQNFSMPRFTTRVDTQTTRVNT